jgi:hypothetical protein
MRYLNLGPATGPSARAAILAMALAGPAAGAAHAGEVIDATNPAAVLSIVSNFGDAELTNDGMGDPLIEGHIEGKEYALYFYDCKANRDCKSLMFLATREAEGLSDETLAQTVAEWNREQRFGKAYIDEDDRAAVEMNVNLHGGVTRDNLTDTIDWWRLVLAEFSDY